ncbi:flavin-containing monooxygenase [Kineobactrum salinum]|uniref:NAD(P)/FAD-dependent oxidoreductase n=1 Tax=Kineobactrum salinum TaxID=2708301 RepID=A0A6C0U789_9GAMM|nr:NAD(P)/FAD-dependent oxidoreductase [Kineobactrum salinum]QIB66817.1 NAD(P)/FAD-dependent oxidoreductase [Kineobactrum salinum]
MQNHNTVEKNATAEIDVEAWREKCRQERDKRLREDGESQYIHALGDFSEYADSDPFIDKEIIREPLTDEIEVVVIGGGFSGLMAGAQLRSRGISSFRIIEAAGDFGGCWYWNRYPGAQCDIESYVYLPLLEETDYMPKEKYSFAAEIFEHCQRVGHRYDLYRNTCFQTKVAGIEWDDESSRWIIRTNRNDAMKARFVMVAVGVGSKPKLPGIQGIRDFEGPNFHTSHWDFEFTGGDPGCARWDAKDDGEGGTGKLDKLGDKVVAVIGTGATGIQCIPYLARDAKQVYVFQRTPNTVSLRGGNPETDPEWAENLESGWQKKRQENFEDVVIGKAQEDLVDDCWTHLFTEAKAFMKRAGEMTPEQLMFEAEVSEYKVVNRVQKEIEQLIDNQEVAEALKPWYRLSCKRPGYNDEYIPAFNRSNVALVDVSESKGVEKITKDGVVANGKEYKVDCIIFATGFEIAITDFKTGIGFDVVGRNGVSIFDHWANGIRSLHGHSTVGFPNWFYIGFSQNGFGLNQGYMLQEQVKHVTYIIDEAIKRGAKVAEVTLEAEDEWVSIIRENSMVNRPVLESCTPGFYNNEGHLRGGILSESYALGVREFNKVLEAWRQEGNLKGFMLKK